MANNPLWKEQNILQAVVMDHFIVGWPLQLHPASWRLPGLGNFSANFQFCHQHIEALSRISNWIKMTEQWRYQDLHPARGWINYTNNAMLWCWWSSSESILYTQQTQKSFLDQLLNPLPEPDPVWLPHPLIWVANFMINNLGWVQWVLLYKHWSYKASQLPKFSTRSEYKWDYCRQWIFKAKTLDSTFF